MVVCQQCGNEYKSISNHWAQSSCEYPPLSEHQHEIVVGLLMGDGWLDRGSKNPRISTEMVSSNYLSHLDDEFGVFGTGVSLRRTAEENAKKNRDNGFGPDAHAENYSDIYCWGSRKHPDLSQYIDWYSSGRKVWSEDIKLTPTTLKHWYCGDGCWDNSGSNNRIRIAMANEIDNTEKVERMFERSNLSIPNNWSIREGPNGGKICSAVFTVEQSHELWEYMGEPLPDFAYKWPDQYC